MKKLIFTAAMLCSAFVQAQENQQAYKVQANDPEWVVKMYQSNPNLFELRTLYHAYYQTHEFVKNRHTQYFKRLMKENWSYVDAAGFIDRSINSETNEQAYLQAKKNLEAQKASNSAWGVNVFPNPTTGNLTVSWNKTMVPDRMEIINVMGQTISIHEFKQ